MTRWSCCTNWDKKRPPQGETVCIRYLSAIQGLYQHAAEHGNHKGCCNNRQGASAAFFFLKQHDVTEARAGRQAGDEGAEADRAADEQFGEQHAHRTAGDQPEDRTQERLEQRIRQEQGSQNIFADQMDGDIEHQHNREQKKRGLDGVPDDAPYRGSCAAVARGHFDLNGFIAFQTVTAEYGVFENVTAGHCDGEFDHEQKNDLRYARTACKKDGHSFVRRGKENRDQRCRRKISGGKQRRRRCGKAALRDGARQCADNRAELRRAGEQRRCIGEPVFDIIKKGVYH